MFPEAYRRILGARGVKQPLAGVIIGRLSIAAEPLATVLMIRGTGGSFALAGAVLGAYSIAAAISLPAQGRIIDRAGQTRVILTATPINAVGFVALILLAHGGAAPLALVAAGAVAGLGTLSTGSAMRTLWADLVPDPELRQAAFALDAVALDIAWVVGPLIAAAVIALASPTAALSVCIGLAILGSAVFASSRASRRWRGEPTEHRRVGPLRSPSVWALMGAAFGVGLAVGAGELAITAFTSEHGRHADRGAGAGEHRGRALVRGAHLAEISGRAAPRGLPRLRALLGAARGRPVDPGGLSPDGAHGSHARPGDLADLSAARLGRADRHSDGGDGLGADRDRRRGRPG
jgi:hypothetical protein